LVKKKKRGVSNTVRMYGGGLPQRDKEVIVPIRTERERIETGPTND